MKVIKYDIPKTSSTGNTKTSVGYIGSGDGGGITLDELKEAVAHYLRKDADDVAQGIIRYMSEQKLDGGATFGNYFAGLDGAGGKIDRNGDGELNSLAVRRGLNVNEASLKYDDETRTLSLTDTQGSLLNFLGGIVFNKDFSINTEGVAVLKSIFALDNITTKNLTVSGLFKVFQLVIDKVKAASGGIICTSADGFAIDVVEDNQQSLDDGIYRTSIISNPNNGYIDTGVVPTNNTRIKARVRVTRPVASSLQVLYGATADNIDDYFDADYSDGDIVYTYDADKVAVSVDGESVSIVSEDLSYPYLLGMTNGESASKLLVNFGNTYDGTLDNEEGVITIEQSLSGITVGSATKAIDFAHLDVENLSKTLYLFANNGIEGADSFCHNVEILDLKIYEGEQVIRDYCPARYTTMGPRNIPVTVYGLFDRINHDFKQSEGDAFGGNNTILPATYTLYWRATDFSGKQRGNMWQVGDQALCQSYNNAVAGETRTASNKKYWALVTAVSDFSNPIEVTLPDGTSAPCHYISISKTDYTGTLNPEIGDDIVMLGNRTDAARQSAIYLTAYDSLDTGYTGNDKTISGITAPLLAFYAGINDFNLSKHRTTFFANGENSLQGNLKIATGQSVEDYVAGELGGMNNGLLATGVDITNGKIDMVASQFTLRDNDGTERIKATNGKVSVSGDIIAYTFTTSTGKFRADTNGGLVATGGSIGGWTIDEDKLYSNEARASIRMSLDRDNLNRQVRLGGTEINARDAMLWLRNDAGTCASFESYGDNAQALTLHAQAGNNTFALDSYGNARFALRPTEIFKFYDTNGDGRKRYYTDSNNTKQPNTGILDIRVPLTFNGVANCKYGGSVYLPAHPSDGMFFFCHECRVFANGHGIMEAAGDNIIVSASGYFDTNDRSHIFVFSEDANVWIDFYCG